MTDFLPHDIVRCNRDDCPLHLECARWLDRLPMEEYWYSQFEPKGCENFIEKKDIKIKQQKKQQINIYPKGEASGCIRRFKQEIYTLEIN